VAPAFQSVRTALLLAAPGDTRKMLDDCVVLKPTVFCAVPRVFERVYEGVMNKVLSFFSEGGGGGEQGATAEKGGRPKRAALLAMIAGGWLQQLCQHATSAPVPAHRAHSPNSLKPCIASSHTVYCFEL